MNQVLTWLVGDTFLMSKTFKISLNGLFSKTEILYFLAWRTATGLMDFFFYIIWGLGAFPPSFVADLLYLHFCVWAGTLQTWMSWVFPCLHP